MGVPLFERRRGKIALNQNGELLLKSVEQAVSLLDAGVQAVRNQHSGRPEPLSIVCMTDDTTLLEHFLLEHPEVNLIHQRADLPNVTSLLDRCEVDLAMTVLPPPSEEVVYERIYACSFGMLMRREHPLAALPAVAHRELAGVHLAIDGSRVNKETFCAAENSKFGLTPIIDYDVRHLDLLTSLVESNNCVSIVPAVKYKELSLQGKHPDLVFREYADGAPTAYWGIAYNKRRPLTELGLCFRTFAQSYFTSIDARYADAQEPSAG